MAKRTELKEVMNHEDTLFASLMTLSILEQDKKYEMTAELAYILNGDDFFNLIKCLGGRTIRIPTDEEVKTQLRTILLYQYLEQDKIPWKDAIVKAGFSPSEGHKAHKNYKILQETLQKIKYGGMFNASIDT